jgi:hypothetical protein
MSNTRSLRKKLWLNLPTADVKPLKNYRLVSEETPTAEEMQNHSVIMLEKKPGCPVS